MTTEFEIGGRRYKASNMPARTSFHVLRRIAPVLTEVSELRAVLETAQNAAAGASPEAVLHAAAPMFKLLADMPDEQADYVIDACMGLVSREEGVGWPLIWNKQSRRPQYDDITMPLMMQIVVQVLMSAFSDFFRSPPSNSSALQGVMSGTIQ